MPNELPDYLIGDKGVQLTGSPIHTPDGGLLAGENVEFVREQGLGGIGSRRSLTPLNAVGLAGDVKQIANLPFPYPTNTVLMIALNNAETGLAFITSPDGATFTATVLTTLAKRQFDIGQLQVGFGGSLANPLSFFIASKAVAYRRRYYYASDDYVPYYSGGPAASRPVLAQYDGSLGLELFRLPDNPTATAGSLPTYIVRLDVIGGLIYLCVHDPGGVAPDLKGRVLTFDPEDGTLALVGNRFGNGTGENTAGMPYALRTFGGRLFCGTMGISGNPAGKVYSILVGVETTWTLDRALAVDDGYCMDLLEFKGNLYMATSCDASGTARVDARTGAGAWSASFTGPATNVAYCGGLVEFDGNLYCGFSGLNAATKYLLIKKFDGTTWTTDKDVLTDYALTGHTFGTPFVYRSELYFPCFEAAAAGVNHATGFLLKRTTAGVYSRVLLNRGIRGGLATYRDPTADEIGPTPPVVMGPFSSGFSSGFGA